MTWRPTVLELRKSIRQKPSISRKGLVRDDGLIAVEPKKASKLAAWRKKMGI